MEKSTIKKFVLALAVVSALGAGVFVPQEANAGLCLGNTAFCWER